MNVFNSIILARNRQLPDDDRMIGTCRSIFKSFNVNNWSVCIGWCADQVIICLVLGFHLFSSSKPKLNNVFRLRTRFFCVCTKLLSVNTLKTKSRLLSLGDCSVHRLREDSRNLCTEQSPKESDDTRCCTNTITRVLS